MPTIPPTPPTKYNPIEHRLFPHVPRAYQGVIFDSVEIAKNEDANRSYIMSG
ncbi:MAG: hypothetical protein KME50_05435 [Nostoc desertorum CM1-VF14]|nr:hypothetical protein [Nostoc desertorum CM1-VF14]